MDEEGDKYIFHRVTHSKTSGGKKNWPIKPNPLLGGGDETIYIVKIEQIEKKGRFSLFELSVKKNKRINYSFIKLKKDIKK